MRNALHARSLGSLLQLRDSSDSSARERVLLASFWLPSQGRGADVIALDAVRAQREQTRK